jgi:hypothetical protein
MDQSETHTHTYLADSIVDIGCSLRDIELAKALFVIAFVGKHPYSGTDVESINRYGPQRA